MSSKKIFLVVLAFILLFSFSGCTEDTSTISGELSNIQFDDDGNMNIIMVRQFNEDENNYITVGFSVNSSTKVYIGPQGKNEMSLEDLSKGMNVDITYAHASTDTLTTPALIIRIRD
ncbi:UNVERIFIED_CONTAM: hypothetical protein Cloal_0943 [Acetivibrio alkalicellulosi]